MKKIIQSETLSTGFAMFAMFFGAGNIIFPLVVGQYAGSHNLFAIFGLIITAVIMPFLGVFAMILYDGDYRNFFGRVGKIPGFLLALTILTLLGPLGSVPRCIALSYSTLKASFPNLSSIYFSAAACVLIFFLTVKKNRLIDLLGKFLTPALLITLFIIIMKGLLTPVDTIASPQSTENLFWYGLKEGYNTMDLMAAFFFSSAIITLLKNGPKETIQAQGIALAISEEKNRVDDSLVGGRKLTDEVNKAPNYLKLTIKASFVGAILLALVYIGFSYIASFHGQSLAISGKDELLSALTIKIAGPSAGLLACTTIALACLTTAIALSAVFSDFIQKEVLQNRVRYEWVLAGSLLATFFVSTFEFNGIAAFLGPVLEVCYPCLIVLTVTNIVFYKLGTGWVMVPTFLVLALSIINSVF